MAGAVYGISGTLRCPAELCVRSLQARESHLFHCQESPFRPGCRFGRRISSNGTRLKANSLFSINSFSSLLAYSKWTYAQTAFGGALDFRGSYPSSLIEDSSIMALKAESGELSTDESDEGVVVLVIGGGGREHALCYALQRSSSCDAVFCAPGNAGIADSGDATCISDLDIDSSSVVISFCRRWGVGLVVVGPEAPLVAGLVNDLVKAGIPTFGPSSEAAALEGSKDFMKKLCDKYGIPTAKYQTFTNASDAKNYIKKQGAPIVVKADGLASGKGVFVAQTLEEAYGAVDSMLLKGSFGSAGRQIIVEEFLEGEEASFFALVDGENALWILTAHTTAIHSMALRDLVTGGAACAVPGAPSSSSNPLGALADSIFGSSSKTQERIKELPTLAGSGPIGTSELRTNGPLTSLPGSEYEQDQFQRSNMQGSEFLHGFKSADHARYEGAWNESTRMQHLTPPVPYQTGEGHDYFPEFEQIYDQGLANFQAQPDFDGTPQRVLSGFLRSFVDSSRAEAPFRPAQLPVLGLSEGDKRCIRDRSSIMARHFFADKSEDYINAQVNALLHSLDIENDLRAWTPPGGRFPELEEYWNESQGAGYNSMSRNNFDTSHPSDKWVTEYSQGSNISRSWAEEFEQNHGAEAWAGQFNQEQSQMQSMAQMRNMNISNAAALEQTRMLAHTLSQNQDPKFQNSKFLQFVSKMSRGELIVDDNQVKPAGASSANAWADEYHLQHNGDVHPWAAEFTAGEHSHHGDAWATEFVQEKQGKHETDDQWINEFSKLHMQDWAEEFTDNMSKGTFEDGSADTWADSYEKFLEEQLKGEQQLPASSRFVYSFADQNPYVGHPNPLKEGQDLFRKGLLSEAVLALEAEVLKNPDNAEGWRLLGITHAENDDDQQAIASMVRARDADPTNLEVLLALGVSHTNELEQAAALRYLRGWLQHHQKYGVLVPHDQAENLSHVEVARLFNEAAQMSPEDGDVHTVLGVLYNLSREYDKAIRAFQTALKLKPRDYSLWNKLGATQANSAQSADAIYAYQQALDLKPNYVRAWANMGISFANQGRYEESICYYVRALVMNPKAENAWQYLRISLSCAARADLMEACDMRDLDTLQKEFPL